MYAGAPLLALGAVIGGWTSFVWGVEYVLEEIYADSKHLEELREASPEGTREIYSQIKQHEQDCTHVQWKEAPVFDCDSRKGDEALLSPSQREAKQLGFKMSASPRPRD